jgi:hypothetical protein
MSSNFKHNWFKKTWWKFTDVNKYREYKRLRTYHNLYARTEHFIGENKHLTLNEIRNNFENVQEINLMHSGNAGDIIYSLPVVKKLREITGKPVNIMLKLNEPLQLLPGDEHPLVNVMLNDAMADKLVRLLTSQTYVNSAAVLNKQEIHINLSLFRESGLELDRGNIARWNFYTTGINTNLSDPWLHVNPNHEFADTIALARSSRYNNPFIDYSFLSAYKNIIFLGVRSEYERMKKSIAHLYWHQVDDFLEMAEVISGSKLFIGNQSFPYAIAEGLKSLRILEVYHQCPNVIPEGENGYDFYFQKHFEDLVSSLSAKKSYA